VEKICGFITNYKIVNESIAKLNLKNAIEKQIFKGNYIFVINQTDKFNILAFEICKQLKKELPFIQIFFNNNDYSLHEINILFCCSDLTETEKTKLPFKANEFINVLNKPNNNLYENYNFSKYISNITLK